MTPNKEEQEIVSSCEDTTSSPLRVSPKSSPLKVVGKVLELPVVSDAFAAASAVFTDAYNAATTVAGPIIVETVTHYVEPVVETVRAKGVKGLRDSLSEETKEKVV
jgi:hypothetical protein